MSLNEWKKLYYPIPAARVLRQDSLEHSIRKWEGLSKEVLRRFGLKRHFNIIYDAKNGQDTLGISTNSCALCFQWVIRTDTCNGCPLWRIRDGKPCDEKMEGESESPYVVFKESGNNLPMLKWLKKIRTVQSQKKS